jgi:hypothetical protein
MNQFFVNYYIGARGDFLIRCLFNGVSDFDLLKALSIFSKMPTPVDYSVKTHGDINANNITEIQDFPKKSKSWAELFDVVNRYQLVKIKIVAKSFEECIDVLWFSLSKTKLYGVELTCKLTIDEVPLPTLEIIDANINYILTGIIVDIPYMQNLDKEFQHEYDYIVKFEDLFNANYIRDLYKKINGKDMDYLQFKAIEKNIAMQYRISKTEFYPIIRQRYDALAIN